MFRKINSGTAVNDEGVLVESHVNGGDNILCVIAGHRYIVYTDWGLVKNKYTGRTIKNKFRTNIDVKSAREEKDIGASSDPIPVALQRQIGQYIDEALTALGDESDSYKMVWD